MRRFEDPALDAETGFELSGKAGEAAVSVTYLVPERGAADSLCSSPDGPPLYECKTRYLSFFRRSLRQNGELAATHTRPPVHY